MISYEEACAIVEREMLVLASERIPLRTALGRVLADPLIAQTSQPPFDASAMDGYAVVSSVIDVGSYYPVTFEVAAGDAQQQELRSGEVARIFTGAPIPQGADSVIIQENAQVRALEGGLKEVAFASSVSAGRNVRRCGQDFVASEELLAAGTQMNAAQIGLAAAANVSALNCVKQPKVCLISTGDELVAPGSALTSGQIVGSNDFALASLFESVGAQVEVLASVGDQPSSLEARLKSALDSDADLIVTTGGASVGDHDHVVPMFERLGAEQHFWRVAMRPGKPVAMLKHDTQTIFALPGNPVSAYVTAQVLVLPAIRQMAGLQKITPKTAHLRADLPKNGERMHFLRGILQDGASGLEVTPIAQTDSAHLSSLAQSNCLILIDANAPAQSAGEQVQIIPI